MMSDFQWAMLWSDGLFWGLIFVFGASLWASRQNERIRQTWIFILKKPQGMATLLVLLAFLTIALADSIHVRLRLPESPAQSAPVYAPALTSALDLAFYPLKINAERTYSAPFATHSFSKENSDSHHGRDYPRLKYGGQHLTDPGERDADIAYLTGKALLWGGLCLMLVGLGLSMIIAHYTQESLVSACRRLCRGQTVLACRTAWITLSILGFLVACVLEWTPFYHVFGTDKAGQDVFFLSLKAVRTAMLIGILTTLILMPVALLLGTLAGYLGGWVDDAVQYLYTVLNAIPGVLLIAAAVLMIQGIIDANQAWFSTAAHRADARLLALCFILGMTSWTGLCRLLRAEVLKLRELEFIQAARAFNVGTFTILHRHLLPNVMHIVLITLVLDFSGFVLAEAVLSYIGIGVDPETVSFGSMINAARAELARDPVVWWSLSAAFCFMFTLVLCANVFADVVRDALDPRSRH